MKINDMKYRSYEILLASIADRLSLLIASLNGSDEVPKLILDSMIGTEKNSNKVAFDSIEAFEEARRLAIERST